MMKPKGSMTWFSIGVLLMGTAPAPLLTLAAPMAASAQTGGAAGSEVYDAQQLDALLAPVALYPDTLLTQVLIGATHPDEVLEAARWLETPANKALSGDALTRALARQTWDVSVKSLVPFPQVVAMMQAQIDWTHQVGWAMTYQEPDVWTSVQRLRAQAQAAGNLRNTQQQLVQTQGSNIIIVPAQPNVVFVPVYDPRLVFGTWRWAAFPPVYLPPPPGFYVGAAIFTGFAFGAAIGINNSLWGWGHPRWGWGRTTINVNQWNTINVNRPPIRHPDWRPPSNGRPGNRPGRPPGGPVGRPEGRPGGNRPGGGGGNRPGGPGGRPGDNGGINRPGGGGNRPGGPGNRPGGDGGAGRPGGGNRPGGGGNGGNRPGTRPGGPGTGGGHAGNRPTTRPGGPGSGGGHTGNRPTTRPGGPGSGGGNAGNRPVTRPGGGGTRPAAPEGRPGGGQRPNNPQARPGGGGNRHHAPQARPGGGGNRPNASRPPAAQPRGGGGGGRQGGGGGRAGGGGGRGGGG